jgi:benzoate-CoA ligase
VTFSTTKLFHAYGLGNGLTFPFAFGASSVLLDGRPAPAPVLETIARFRPTLFFSVPTLYNAILSSPEAERADLGSVRLCVSAAEQLPADVWRRWEERFGVTILDGVGSTEMLHIYLSNRAADCVPGSTGRAVEGYHLRIVDDEGRDVERGTAGTLQVSGDSALALYWGQHQKTVRSLLGEWFVTGDRYRQDERGYFWYEGRADDMIKVGGLWVSPVEIESALIEHPAVVEGAVVGISVDGLVRIKAYVIPQGGADGAGDELRAQLRGWCKDRLQRYQYPHLIDFVDELPKTATGKIQRYRLREASPVPAVPPAPVDQRR